MNSPSKNSFSPPVALAPWACDPWSSRGRLIAESESRTRTVFQRDRDRIVHAGAFRRLKHKTQVFVYHEGDYYRTRLTHSLEVAQIARSVCRVLGLNEDLAETLALAHDLGHPPFGHAGENALDRCMADFGGFDHNAQALRIVTRLEQRYLDFDGLNLTWETLEGIVKHNGPLIGMGIDTPLPYAIREYADVQDLELHSYPSAEAQICALADEIAYNTHDIDDGLRAGLLDLEAMREAPLVGPIFAHLMERHPDAARGRIINEAGRRLITVLISDLVNEIQTAAMRERVCSPDHVRGLGKPLVGFSRDIGKGNEALKQFLRKHVYRHYKVNRAMSRARRVVEGLFAQFLEEPELLPTEWQEQCDRPGTRVTARIVCDYIAGMTDRYAYEEHRRLFDLHSRMQP